MLATYLTDQGFWINIWPIPIAAAAIAAMAATVRLGVQISYARRFVLLNAFSMLGIVIGKMTGQSREAAVVGTVGAILTLLGGTLIYLLGTKDTREQVSSAAAVYVLSVSLLVGTEWGAILRDEYDAAARSADSVADIQLQKELADQKLRDLRQELQLPPPKK